jgi:hypothetical protein
MKKVTYLDSDGNELTAHINDKNLLFILVGKPEDEYYNGYICLDKDDVALLIEDLKKLLSEM